MQGHTNQTSESFLILVTVCVAQPGNLRAHVWFALAVARFTLPGSWCQVRAAMSALLLDSSIDTEGLQMAETALHIWFFSTFHLYPSFPVATQSFYSDEHCWFLWWWPPDIPRWCHSVGFSGMRERDVLLAQHAWWYVSAGSRVFKQLWQKAAMITAHVMI